MSSYFLQTAAVEGNICAISAVIDFPSERKISSGTVAYVPELLPIFLWTKEMVSLVAVSPPARSKWYSDPCATVVASAAIIKTDEGNCENWKILPIHQPTGGGRNRSLFCQKYLLMASVKTTYSAYSSSSSQNNFLSYILLQTLGDKSPYSHTGPPPSGAVYGTKRLYIRGRIHLYPRLLVFFISITQQSLGRNYM